MKQKSRTIRNEFTTWEHRPVWLRKSLPKGDMTCYPGVHRAHRLAPHGETG